MEKATVIENITVNGRPAVTAGSPFRVAGTQFPNDEPGAPHRQAVIVALKVGDVLECRREPDNAFDTNAVAFYGTNEAPAASGRIGFMPAQMAAELAEDIDGGWFIAAQVTAIKPNRLDVYQVSVRLIEWLDVKK
jgi:hypothetical protein